MSLTDEYQKQFAWRDWDRALAACPIEPGQRVLDLGCGPGDLSAELIRRGAIVTGTDGNEDLLAAARLRCPAKATFLKQDLNFLQLTVETFDGLWCSFAAAYFTDFESVFTGWLPFLRKKAWVCVVEMDDLFGHEPLSDATKSLIHDFYKDARQAGRYDFRSGGKLGPIIEKYGFELTRVSLADKELAFDGVASAEVVEAWKQRMNRMGGLKTFLGERFSAFQHDFIRCISSPEHSSRCKVYGYIGVRR